mgnify:CR=1 FL=1
MAANAKKKVRTRRRERKNIEKGQNPLSLKVTMEHGIWTLPAPDI